MDKTTKQENGDRVKRNPLLEAALTYARLGWYVIPLHNPTKDGKCSCGKTKCNRDGNHVGKHPRISDWQNQGSIDPEQIKNWWRQWPDANIGIVAGKSGLVILDVDPDKGGIKSFNKWFNNTWPETPTSRTGGRGFHLAFQRSEGHVGNRTGVAPGLDIKADGGYFVAPPSLHKSGHRYEWNKGRGPEIPIVPMPQSLIDLLKKGKNGDGNKPECTLNGPNSVPHGTRNDSIFKYASKLARKGLSREEIEILALKKAESCEQPPEHPYTEEELKTSVESALKYSTEEPQPEIIDLKDLMEKELPEPKFIVPNLLPEGVTIFAGDPKVGKSMLSTDIALSIALGSNIRPVLGAYECVRTGVLYLALEESERNFRNRVSKMIGSQPVPDNIHLSFDHWPDGENAVDRVDSLLEKWSDVGLVIIDTLELVRPKNLGRKREYTVDYEAIKPWRDLAGYRQVAIIIITHKRKAHDDDALKRVSGTMGLTGAADTIMVMERKRKNKYAVIEITGRTIQETKLVVEFNDETLTWTAQNPDEYLLSAQRQEILELLQRLHPVELGPREIAEMLGMKQPNVRQLLSKMSRDKQIIHGSRGSYCAELQLQPKTWEDDEHKVDIQQRLKDL